MKILDYKLLKTNGSISMQTHSMAGLAECDDLKTPTLLKTQRGNAPKDHKI
jgi:hypothetical protein